MMVVLPLFLTLLLLTGGGIATVVWAGRDVRHPLDLPLLFLSGALGLPATLALILADANNLKIQWVWLIVGVLILSGALLNRKQLTFSLPKQTLGILSAALLLLALLFSRPFEYLLGGWDPGEYVSTAAHMQRTGGIDYMEPFLVDLPPDLEPRVFRTWAPPRSTLHAGYLVVDTDTGHMVPDYFHLYPAWLSLFTSHGTLSSAYQGQTVLAVLATLLALLAVARFASPRVAVLMGLCFVTQPAVLYFARFTSSEFLSMGLLFGLIGIWKIQDDTPDWIRSLWFGLLVYAAVTCHITNLLPLVGLGMMGVLLGFSSFLKSPGRELLALGTATGLGILRNLYGTPVFSEHLVQEYLVERPDKVIPILLAPLLLGGVGWMAWKTYGNRLLASKGINLLIRWGPASLLLLAALYQYVLRPRLSEDPNALNLQSLGWVVSPAGLVMALAALFTFDWRKTPRALLLFLAAAGLSAAVLIHHKNVQPIYFWAYRRYLPMTLPLIALLMAWAIEKAWTGPWRRWATPAMGLLGLFSVGWQLRAALPVMKIREHHGLAAFVSDVATPVSETGFLLVDHWKLASPLRHGFGLPAYPLTREPDEIHARTQDLLHAFILERATSHAPAHYLTHGSPFAAPGLQVTPLTSAKHQSEILEWRRKSLPKERVPTQTSAHLYHLTPSRQPYEPEHGTVRFQIGYHSLGLAKGFYAHQTSRGRNYRWTDGEARLYLPAFRTPSTLRLSLAHMRPEALGTTTEVSLLLNGQLLTTLTLQPGWTEHEVELPVGTGPTFTLDLKSDTWNPTDFDISGYPPRLGIRVEWVEVSPHPPPENSPTT